MWQTCVLWNTSAPCDNSNFNTEKWPFFVASSTGVTDYTHTGESNEMLYTTIKHSTHLTIMYQFVCLLVPYTNQCCCESHVETCHAPEWSVLLGDGRVATCLWPKIVRDSLRYFRPGDRDAILFYWHLFLHAIPFYSFVARKQSLRALSCFKISKAIIACQGFPVHFLVSKFPEENKRALCPK